VVFQYCFVGEDMKRVTLIAILSLCLAGSGCLEAALEYPKEYGSNSPEVTEATVSLIGVIRSIDPTSGQMELETVSGLIEEVSITPEAIISLNIEEGKTILDLTVNSLAEMFGTRDPSTLIINARTIRMEDVTKVKIVAPATGATVTSPLIVDGFTKTNDQNVYWRIKDQNNATQLSGFSAVIGEGENYTPFRLEIYLPALDANNFTLEVFSKQGSVEVGLVALPLNLLSIKKSEFEIFLSNNYLNTNKACNAVFPVKRTVAETSAVGRASLIELLNGPTDSERYEGFRSSLPYNTTISSFVISGGIATVTVSKDFNSLSTCEKQRATEQIKQTLLQFGLVDDVTIQVEN
jgi:hypothetical protein